MKYVPLHCHSYFSLLDGLSKPGQIAHRIRSLGLSACAISDHGSVSGVVGFMKAMQGACKHCGHQGNQHADGGKGKCTVAGVNCPGYEKEPLKSILGNEFYISRQDAGIQDKTNGAHSHLVVLAKNREGWKRLAKATSASNRPEHFYRRPRLSLEQLAGFSGGNFVTFSGHPGSDLGNVIFADIRKAYSARDKEDAKAALKDQTTLQKDLLSLAGRYQELFGKDNFFLEIQLIDEANLPAAGLIASALRWASKKLNIPCVATPDAHYPAREDAKDQRILLCRATDTTLEQAKARLEADEDFSLGGFFRSNRYYIPSAEEMEQLHTADELSNTLRIAEMCESYDITGPPKLPQFDCGKQSPEERLRELCRQGWRKKVFGKVAKDKHDVYRARVESELAVLQGAGLSPYFLIVEDYNRHARDVLKCKASKGRGSGAGSLVLHLLGVTDCDPIEHDLLFERFYNAGRNAPGRVSLPDVDCDFPIGKRDKVKDYIKAKYGPDYVCEMATFSRSQGRGALTDVLRAHQWGTFEERKAVTAHIPDEAAIADKLQEMREETGEASILRWALENHAEELKAYSELNDDGTLTGPLAEYFAQAMRIEGTKSSQSKHAAGLIISTEPLSEVCPMIYDRSTDQMIAGMEMNDLESMGFVKFDILGVAALDKAQGALDTVRTGKVGVA